MLFISETCEGWKPTPTMALRALPARLQQLLGIQRSWREGRWPRAGQWKQRLLRDQPSHLGLGICWYFIITVTAFALKDNNLQIPQFWCEPQYFQWLQNKSRFTANVLHSFQWSSTLARCTETHETAPALLAIKPNWKLFQAQEEDGCLIRRNRRREPCQLS